MTIQLEIPDSLAIGLVRLSESSGQTPEEVALSAIKKRVEPLSTLNTCLEPIRKAFKASGLSEDEAVELFEAEKHSMRRSTRRNGNA